MPQKRLPIGYYLKLADTCLTKGIDDIQSQHGLNRLDWQILNSICEKPGIRKQEIIATIHPLADADLIENILSIFRNKGVIEKSEEILALTTAGQDLHKACFNVQQAFRTKAMAGISETDYQTTISTLKKMIDNIQEK